MKDDFDHFTHAVVIDIATIVSDPAEPVVGRFALRFLKNPDGFEELGADRE